MISWQWDKSSETLFGCTGASPSCEKRSVLYDKKRIRLDLRSTELQWEFRPKNVIYYLHFWFRNSLIHLLHRQLASASDRNHIRVSHQWNSIREKREKCEWKKKRKNIETAQKKNFKHRQKRKVKMRLPSLLASAKRENFYVIFLVCASIPLENSPKNGISHLIEPATQNKGVCDAEKYFSRTIFGWNRVISSLRAVNGLFPKTVVIVCRARTEQVLTLVARQIDWRRITSALVQCSLSTPLLHAVGCFHIAWLIIESLCCVAKSNRAFPYCVWLVTDSSCSSGKNKN